MQEHQGFMWHYVAKLKEKVNAEFLAPKDDFDTLVTTARAYVGNHNEIDSCSTERRESLHGNTHTFTRGSSFGQRTVTITLLPVLSGE